MQLAVPATTLSDISSASIMAQVEYFGLKTHLRLFNAATLGIPGSSSQRVLDIVRAVGGTVYITGHGACNYLDHEASLRLLESLSATFSIAVCPIRSYTANLHLTCHFSI